MRVVVAVGWVLVLGVVWAEPPSATELPELVVTASVDEPTETTVSEDALREGRHPSLGSLLLEVPGVFGVRRSSDMVEPVIRGFGWERVQTLVDGLPLYGACPARMDPPVNYVSGEALQRATLDLALPSVTLGPVGAGRRIALESGDLPDPTEQITFGGWLQATWDEGRQGPQGNLGLEAASQPLSLQAGVHGLDYTDYQAADGTRVPADHESYGANLALEWRPAANHAWRHSYIYTHEEDVEYPALPMDADESEFHAYTTRYQITDLSDWLTLVELRFGVQEVDHLMSNTDKPNRSVMEAYTPTTSTSYAAGLKAGLALSEAAELTIGVDTSYLEREALRTRRMVMSGMVFRDAIWPDVTQHDTGAFAELNWQPASRLSLRLGTRLDYVVSDADNADAPSLQNRTVRQQFVRFYGPAAAEVEDSETLAAANLLATWQATEALSLWAGTGFSERPASVTERYFAFAPAPGGFQVGNPTLDAEEHLTTTAGFDWETTRIAFQLSGYHTWVHDYILPERIARQDVNMDGNPDTIRGYHNVDAVVYGGEAAMVLKPNEHWSLPVSLAYVRGINTSDSRDLPEIPPLEVRAAIRAEYGERLPWWAQFGVRYAAEQNQVDEQFPEDETAAFTVCHLRAGIDLRDGLSLECGIENLFDEAYHEHLTREATLAAGDLAAGDEIPAAERTFYATIRWTF